MKRESVISAYRRYAHVYDLLFGPIMNPGRRRIIEALRCKPNDSILEVGVGTGLSLPLYPDYVKVTGIDISREMLGRARERVERLGLSHVESILEMDGQRTCFIDNRFDKVVAMYVVSVAPDPVGLIREMRRVCKPGGEIFIVNHFRSKNPLIALGESLASPISAYAGFRPDLDLDQLLRETGLQVVESRGTNLFGYWRMLRCRNDGKEMADFSAAAPRAARN